RRLAGRPAARLLRDDAAGDAAAAAAQRLGMVAVVVAAGVHHQRAALHLGQRQARRQHRIGGGAVGIHIQRRQVAAVGAVVPWGAVVLGAIGIVVAAGRAGGHRLTVLLLGVAIAVLVHVKTMHAGR